MKLTPQGMMNDKANVFKDENQLSHKNVGSSQFTQLCLWKMENS